MGLVKTRAKARTAFPIGSGLTPIARWDVVSRQRIAQGATFNAGVIAFSKYGIARVEFALTDAVGSASQVTVTSMSLNARTGVWEYWTPIVCSNYAPGTLTVSATVTGIDGGTRVLEDILLITDSDGSVPQPEAWVDSISGNDSTGVVNDVNNPFLKFAAAIQAIRTWNNSNGQGNTTTGGVVYLQPGNHGWWNSGIWTEMQSGDEWLTITTVPGGTPTDTKIVWGGDEAILSSLRFKNVGIVGGLGDGLMVASTSNPIYKLWIEGCEITSTQDQWDLSSKYVRGGYSDVYLTECSMDGMRDSVARYMTSIVRNCTITNAGNTVIINTDLVVNTTINEVTPGITALHSNAVAWQNSDWDNRIIYGLKATNLHYSGLSLQRGGTIDNKAFISRDMALVNVDIEMADPIVTGDGTGQFCLLWAGHAEHLLFHNVTMRYTGSGLSLWVYILRHTNDPNGKSIISDSSYRNCNFNRMDADDDTAKLEFTNATMDNNHYSNLASSVFSNADINKTTGTADMDASGVPTLGGNLAGRVEQALVPIDINGTARTSPSDVGAYEKA